MRSYRRISTVNAAGSRSDCARRTTPTRSSVDVASSASDESGGAEIGSGNASKAVSEGLAFLRPALVLSNQTNRAGVPNMRLTGFVPAKLGRTQIVGPVTLVSPEWTTPMTELFEPYTNGILSLP